MKKVKLSKNKMTRLKNQMKGLTDELGEAKQDIEFANDLIENLVSKMKSIYKRIDTNEIHGDSFKSSVSEHKRTYVNWEALAKSFSPSKVRINKYTNKKTVVTLRTFPIEFEI